MEETVQRMVEAAHAKAIPDALSAPHLNVEGAGSAMKLLLLSILKMAQ